MSSIFEARLLNRLGARTRALLAGEKRGLSRLNNAE